ncbi:MAG: helix-turn-helix domain-containing protein [Steroidobacteraceae bacterium]
MIDADAHAALRALASDRRLLILQWLKAPGKHFRPQTYGDLVEDGVCGVFIAQKLGVSQPTASSHLKVLTQARLLRAKRIRQWTFYKRNERRIRQLRTLLSGI